MTRSPWICAKEKLPPSQERVIVRLLFKNKNLWGSIYQGYYYKPWKKWFSLNEAREKRLDTDGREVYWMPIIEIPEKEMDCP